ncbi:sulfatase [Candidatus Daviesbacteria bacterium]|nr:sulfatase [Candidatus Daviesbacteria bacterium]
MTNSRNLLILIIAIIILIPLSFWGIKNLTQKKLTPFPQAQKTPKPFFQNPNINVILISIDTLDPAHLGVYGSTKKTSPNIDEFSKDAQVYTNVFTLIPHTWDSFYTLFTGRDDVLKNEEISQTSSNMDEWEPLKATLPKILRQNGYLTSAFVTNHVIGTLTPFFKKSFEEFNFIDQSQNPQQSGLDSFIPDYDNSKKVTDSTIDWLNKNGGKKFFLWMHFTNPHLPYNPPKEYLCKIDPDCNIPIYKELLDNPLSIQSRIQNCSDKTPVPVVEAAKSLYDAEILSTDEQIGKILSYLKDINLYQNSLIVIYGDHGEGFSHGIFEHGYSLYNSEVKLPLIIKKPNSNQGEKVNTLMDNSDIMPLILESLGVGSKNAERKYVYMLANPSKGNKYGVTDGQFKYIFSDKPGCFYNNLEEELYNLETDPLESNNLIEKDKKKLKQLKSRLLDQISLWGRIRNIGKLENDKEIIEKLKKLGY